MEALAAAKEAAITGGLAFIEVPFFHPLPFSHFFHFFTFIMNTVLSKISQGWARAKGATETVAAEATVAFHKAQHQTHNMSKWDKRIYGTLMILGGFMGQANAQGGVGSTLTSFKATVLLIAQGIFAVFLMIGLVKTAKKFIGGEPDAMTSMMWLAGGVLLFWGFNSLKQQIVGNTGNSGGGGNVD